MSQPKTSREITSIKFEFPFKKGRHSQIWLVRDLRKPRNLAAKVFQKQEVVKKQGKHRLMWEMRVHSKLSHAYFPRLIDTFQKKQQIIMVMEHIEGTNFYEFQGQSYPLLLSESVFYSAQIVLILEHLHKNLILFRDLKSENFILAKDGYLRLLDFGCAKKLGHKLSRTSTLCGTPEIQAPELALGKDHGLAVDLWALGILVYELFAHENPFFNENPMKFFENILKANVRFTKKFPKEAQELIAQLLQRNQDDRFKICAQGFERIKESELFGSIDFRLLEGRKVKPPFFPEVIDLKPIEVYNASTNDKDILEDSYDPKQYLNW